jgi:hypothetical protein
MNHYAWLHVTAAQRRAGRKAVCRYPLLYARRYRVRIMTCELSSQLIIVIRYHLPKPWGKPYAVAFFLFLLKSE